MPVSLLLLALLQQQLLQLQLAQVSVRELLHLHALMLQHYLQRVSKR